MEVVRRLAEEVALREGCRLYDIEFSGGGSHRTLRIFIEKDPGGASLDDCVNVSRGLNFMLDVEDPIPGGKYELEVSTPGLERKLTQLWHFEKSLDQTVQLRYQPPGESPRSVDATVVAVNGNVITFDTGKGPFDVEFSQIQRARQIFQQTKNKPGKGTRGKQ